MQCPNCGNQLSEGAKFCTRCGNAIQAAPASTFRPDAAPTAQMPQQQYQQPQYQQQQYQQPQAQYQQQQYQQPQAQYQQQYQQPQGQQFQSQYAQGAGQYWQQPQGVNPFQQDPEPAKKGIGKIIAIVAIALVVVAAAVGIVAFVNHWGPFADSSVSSESSSAAASEEAEASDEASSSEASDSASPESSQSASSSSSKSSSSASSASSSKKSAVAGYEGNWVVTSMKVGSTSFSESQMKSANDSGMYAFIVIQKDGTLFMILHDETDSSRDDATVAKIDSSKNTVDIEREVFNIELSSDGKTLTFSNQNSNMTCKPYSGEVKLPTSIGASKTETSGTSASTKSSQAASSKSQKLVKSGTLTVAISPDYPPFESLDSAGKPTGFDVELIQAVGESLGLKAEFVSIDYDKVFVNVDGGKADLAISGITSTPDRAQAYALVPYYKDPASGDEYVIAIAKDNVELQNEVKKAVSDLQSDGTIERLDKKYEVTATLKNS